MIEARHIFKSFGDKKVLSDFSMTIEPGEIIGLAGPSGVGKSTVAKLLCGVLRPDSGEIAIDGKVISSPDVPYDRKLGLAIQMVYQQPYATLDPRQKLYAGFSELIRYHNFAKDKDQIDSLIRKQASLVNLDYDILFHLPHQISGGEAQRVALAKCLLFNPTLLILDEATSMVDVMTQANLMELVQSCIQKTRGSVLLISHDTELVDHMCSRTYSL